MIEITTSKYKTQASLKRVSQDKIDEALRLHIEGYSQNYIASTLLLGNKTVRTIIDIHSKVRTRTEQSYYYHKTSTLREDAFDIITEESAYWLGFIYADGYITNPETHFTIGMMLQASDKPHMEKLKEFLKAPQVIREGQTTIKGKSYPHVRIAIGSQKLHNKLQDYGITHNKSYDAKPPELLIYNRDFWRGIIDGDGYIGILKGARKRKRLQLCGTVDIVEGFKRFMQVNNIATNQVVVKRKGKALHNFQIGDTMAEKVAILLYKDATVYLDRKYNKYLEFIKENN